MKGEAEVHWTEQRSESDGQGGTRTVTEHYRNHEKYFKGKFHICGEGKYLIYIMLYQVALTSYSEWQLQCTDVLCKEQLPRRELPNSLEYCIY